MLKAYSIGFFGAVLAIVVVAAILLVMQPSNEPGLTWGGTVYTSKEEFQGYLKAKGLSYKTWLARNPGAAPWEPEPKPARAAQPAPKEPDGENWSNRLPLTTFGLMLAGACAILLLLRAGPTAAAVFAGQAQRARPAKRERPPEHEAPPQHEAPLERERPPKRARSPERTRPAERTRPEAPVLAQPQPSVRPLTPAVTRRGPSAAVAEPLVALTPPPADPTPVEAPRPRLEEQFEHVCEIRWWRGYVKGQFYAEADPPLDWPVESAAFRPRGRDRPEQSDEAVAAHAALVEELCSAGWEQDGRGAYWYSDRFLRRGRSAAMGPPGLEPGTDGL